MRCVPSKLFTPRTAVVLTAMFIVGCSGDGPAAAAPGKQAKARKGDPELTHHWEMPADKAVLASADIGSDPPALADAMMAGAAAPGISHRITNACAGEGALKGVASVALRWTVTAEGAIENLESDPGDAAGKCFTQQLSAELGKIEGLPAGAALFVLRFHGRGTQAAGQPKAKAK